jgi:hypothetical protein
MDPLRILSGQDCGGLKVPEVDFVDGSQDVVSVVDGVEFAQVVVLSDLLPDISDLLLTPLEVFDSVPVSKEVRHHPEVFTLLKFRKFLILAGKSLKNANRTYERRLELELVGQEELDIGDIASYKFG